MQKTVTEVIEIAKLAVVCVHGTMIEIEIVSGREIEIEITKIGSTEITIEIETETEEAVLAKIARDAIVILGVGVEVAHHIPNVIGNMIVETGHPRMRKVHRVVHPDITAPQKVVISYSHHREIGVHHRPPHSKDETVGASDLIHRLEMTKYPV